jgi:hypothetical protein
VRPNSWHVPATTAIQIWRLNRSHIILEKGWTDVHSFLFSEIFLLVTLRAVNYNETGIDLKLASASFFICGDNYEKMHVG